MSTIITLKTNSLIPDEEVIELAYHVQASPARKVCSENIKENVYKKCLGYSDKDFENFKEYEDSDEIPIKLLSDGSFIVTEKAIYMDIPIPGETQLKYIPLNKITTLTLCSDYSYEQLKYGIRIEHQGSVTIIWDKVYDLIDEAILNNYQDDEEFDEGDYLNSIFNDSNCNMLNLYIELCKKINEI